MFHNLPSKKRWRKEKRRRKNDFIICDEMKKENKIKSPSSESEETQDTSKGRGRGNNSKDRNIYLWFYFAFHFCVRGGGGECCCCFYAFIMEMRVYHNHIS
jgi:hypothetical protein